MEVKKGFKQTEVGVIPEDWEVVVLKDLINKNKPIRYGIVQPGKYDPNGRFMIRGQDYSFGWVSTDQIFRVSRFVEERYKNARLGTGDIILTIVGAGTGHLEIIPNWLDGSNITQTTAKISIDSAKANTRFCKYYLQSNQGQNQIALNIKGAAQPGLNIRDIKTFTLPLPSTLTEQNAIASILSDTDTLILSLEKLIAKKRANEEGAMHGLLKPKKGWVMKKIGEVANTYSGGTPSTSIISYWGGEIPWISSGDLNKGIIYHVEGKITQEGLDNSSAKMIEEDTLLIALYGATAGVTAISKIKAAINQAVLAIIPKLDDYKFLFYQLKQLKNWIISTYTQGGQPNLSGDIVKSIELYFPSISEQTRIVNILSDMDAEIAALETKLAKYKQIKQGMMQTLLTGRIRLV